MNFLAWAKDLTRRLFDPLFSQIAISAGYRQGRHIALAMQRRALAETADYVGARMDKVPPSRSAHDLLRAAAQRCRSEEGLVLEFGVFQGRSLNVLATSFAQKVYGFDSFQGLPEDWRTDSPAGTFAVDRPPRVQPNVELVVGWFHETLGDFLKAHPGPIKFLHVDCDLYSSTVEVLSRCAERLGPGSIIVFDEYFNYPNWQQGEFRAFQELVAARRIEYRYIGYVGTHEQVAVEVLATGDQPRPVAR